MPHHPVFHVSLLQRNKPRPEEMKDPEGWEPIKDPHPSQQPEFEVEALLRSRGKGKEEEFLVKWKGFPETEATWEPLANLGNSRQLVQEFRRQQTLARKRALR